MNPMGWVGERADAPRQPAGLAVMALPALDPAHIRASNKLQAESLQQPAWARRSGKSEERICQIQGTLTARAAEQQQPLPHALRMPVFSSLAKEDDERSGGRAVPKPPKARGWVGGEVWRGLL